MPRARSAVAAALVASVLGAGATRAAAPPGVTVTEGWMRAITRAVPAGGYFTLRNAGPTAVTLTGAASPGCGTLMLHRTESSGGTDTMEMVDQVTVPPGGTVRFAPGGYHLMCMDERLQPGATIPVTLRFDDGRTIVTTFAVTGATGR